MNSHAPHFFFLILFLFLFSACANIVPPGGGPKDVTPPKLRSVTPKDSLLNTRVTKLDLGFNEFITLSDAATQVTISPQLAVAPVVSNTNKHVIVKIQDSLLEENTTYRISFGTAIKDLRENNVFENYTYTFSTGHYFDSLRIRGIVIDAQSGMPDSSGVAVLYNASRSDSSILNKKPLYISTLRNGYFDFKGLPDKSFKLFYIQDKNNNGFWDPEEEKMAYLRDVVKAGLADSAEELKLYSFHVVIADSLKKPKDSTAAEATNARSKKTSAAGPAPIQEPVSTYLVKVDTSDKRSFNINKNLEVKLARGADSVNKDKIQLNENTKDSTFVPVAFEIVKDTSDTSALFIRVPWKEDTRYQLKLIKGFAKDSSGNDFMPSSYVFRTKSLADYATLKINIPSQYYGTAYLLDVLENGKSVYLEPVSDTSVTLKQLDPGNYSIRIIKDDNRNKGWDPGDFFKKIQPEFVFPNNSTILLKSGWDNIVDFVYEPVSSQKPTIKNKKTDKP